MAKYKERKSTYRQSISLRKDYVLPQSHKQEINKQVNNLLENDVIQSSVSPYNSPLVVV